MDPLKVFGRAASALHSRTKLQATRPKSGGRRVVMEQPGCPRCHAPMDIGSLASEVKLEGPKWFANRHATGAHLGIGGESLGVPTNALLGWFDGYRCPRCRLMLLSY